jgi:phosphoglycerate dehydrogenase-like enzyme
MTGDGAVVVAMGPIEDLLADRLRQFAPVVTVGSDAELATLLPDTIALVARGVSVVDRALIERAPRLEVIGRTGIGVDQVDLDAATVRGIPVVVTPTAGTRAVAEGTVGMILHLIKRLGRLTSVVRAGTWSERENWMPGDLDGATVGLVGYGRIGRRVAQLVRCFGADVLVTDPLLTPGSRPDGNPVVELLDLTRHADVISLHAPLTPQTRRLIDATVLHDVCPGAILVNCARGGLLDLDATYEALVDGRLSGVGLDVYDPEPPIDRHPLFDHPDVILTPHVMGLSALAWRRTSVELAAGMVAVLAGGRAQYVANPAIYQPVSGTSAGEHAEQETTR